MQTFLPYPDFTRSAAVLDRQRLGKQRVETYQILRALAYGGGWVHHPIVKMWRGSENALKQYSNAVIAEWLRRGYRNSLPVYDLSGTDVHYPWWLGRDEFHASHRAALLAKDYRHYSQFGWTEKPVINYVWYADNPSHRTFTAGQGT